MAAAGWAIWQCAGSAPATPAVPVCCACPLALVCATTPLSLLPCQVLGQVADYQPPTAAATGRYSLKRECWDEFSPFYPHYTR